MILIRGVLGEELVRQAPVPSAAVVEEMLDAPQLQPPAVQAAQSLLNVAQAAVGH